MCVLGVFYVSIYTLKSLIILEKKISLTGNIVEIQLKSHALRFRRMDEMRRGQKKILRLI